MVSNAFRRRVSDVTDDAAILKPPAATRRDEFARRIRAFGTRDAAVSAGIHREMPIGMHRASFSTECASSIFRSLESRLFTISLDTVLLRDYLKDRSTESRRKAKVLKIEGSSDSPASRTRRAPFTGTLRDPLRCATPDIDRAIANCAFVTHENLRVAREITQSPMRFPI